MCAALESIHEQNPTLHDILHRLLPLRGEFDLLDVAGIQPEPIDALVVHQAIALGVHRGLLLRIPEVGRYCIPFTLRSGLSPSPSRTFSENWGILLVRYCSGIAAEFERDGEGMQPRHWRFSMVQHAFQVAVEELELTLGLEPHWPENWQVIRDVPEELAEAIRNFGLAIGKALVQLDTVDAFVLLAGAAACSNLPGHETTSDVIRNYLGQLMLRHGSWRRAIELYRVNEQAYEARGNHGGRVVAASAVALALREMGSVELAIKEFLRACELAGAHGILETEVDTANCAVRLLLEESRTVEAIRLAHRILGRLRTGGERIAAMAELSVLCGQALRLADRQPEARDQLYAALALAKDYSHRPAEGRACLEIGHLCLESSDPTEATKWFRRARAIFENTNDGGGVAEACLGLAKVAEESTDREECERYIVKALRAAQAARAMELVADAWRARAALVADEDDPTQSIGFLSQEARALRHTRRVARMADCLLRVAFLYAGQRAWMAAANEGLKAQALARAYNLDLLAESNEHLARCQVQMTTEEFDFLVDQVSEELDSGDLYPPLASP
jgi:tetratricopeptide (TPR) repeat protein